MDNKQNKFIFCNAEDIALRHALDEVLKEQKKCYNVNDLLILKDLIEVVKDAISAEISHEFKNHLATIQSIESVQYSNDPDFAFDNGKIGKYTDNLPCENGEESIDATEYIDTEIKNEDILLGYDKFISSLENAINVLDAPLDETYKTKLEKLDKEIFDRVQTICNDNAEHFQNMQTLLANIQVKDTNSEVLSDEFDELRTITSPKTRTNKATVEMFKANFIKIFKAINDDNTTVKPKTNWKQTYYINTAGIVQRTAEIEDIIDEINDLGKSLMDPSEIEALILAIDLILNNHERLSNLEEGETVKDVLRNIIKDEINNNHGGLNNPDNIGKALNNIRKDIKKVTSYPLSSKGFDDLTAIKEAAQAQLDEVNDYNANINAEIESKQAELEEKKAEYRDKWQEEPFHSKIKEPIAGELSKEYAKTNNENVDAYIETLKKPAYVESFTATCDKTGATTDEWITINITEKIPDDVITLNGLAVDIADLEPSEYTIVKSNDEIKVKINKNGIFNISLTLDNVETDEPVVFKVNIGNQPDLNLSFDGVNLKDNIYDIEGNVANDRNIKIILNMNEDSPVDIDSIQKENITITVTDENDVEQQIQYDFDENDIKLIYAKFDNVGTYNVNVKIDAGLAELIEKTAQIVIDNTLVKAFELAVEEDAENLLIDNDIHVLVTNVNPDYHNELSFTEGTKLSVVYVNDGTDTAEYYKAAYSTPERLTFNFANADEHVIKVTIDGVEQTLTLNVKKPHVENFDIVLDGNAERLFVNEDVTFNITNISPANHVDINQDNMTVDGTASYDVVDYAAEPIVVKAIFDTVGANTLTVTIDGVEKSIDVDILSRDVTDFTLEILEQPSQEYLVGNAIDILITNIEPEYHKKLTENDIIVTAEGAVLNEHNTEAITVSYDTAGEKTVEVTIDGVEKSVTFTVIDHQRFYIGLTKPTEANFDELDYIDYANQEEFNDWIYIPEEGTQCYWVAIRNDWKYPTIVNQANTSSVITFSPRDLEDEPTGAFVHKGITYNRYLTTQMSAGNTYIVNGWQDNLPTPQAEPDAPVDEPIEP